MAKRKKGESKFRPRSYRFSLKTQRLISKLAKRTQEDQNDVVRKALECYESVLAVEPEFKVNSKMTDAEINEHMGALDGIMIRQKLQESVLNPAVLEETTADRKIN